MVSEGGVRCCRWPDRYIFSSEPFQHSPPVFTITPLLLYLVEDVLGQWRESLAKWTVRKQQLFDG